MTAQTAHAGSHAHQCRRTAQTPQTAHPLVEGCGVECGVGEPRTTQDATDLASSSAFELVRCALVARMAVDLGDPALARRAARYAQTSAQRLAGLEFPAHVGRDDVDEDQDLASIEDLLERMPSRTEVEEL